MIRTHGVPYSGMITSRVILFSINCYPVKYKAYRCLHFLGFLVHTGITRFIVRLELCAQKVLGGVDPYLFPLGNLEILEFVLRMKNWSEKISNNNKNNYNLLIAILYASESSVRE